MRGFEVVDASPVGVLVRPAGSVVVHRSGSPAWMKFNDVGPDGWRALTGLGLLADEYADLYDLSFWATELAALGAVALPVAASSDITYPAKAEFVNNDSWTMPNGSGGYVVFETQVDGTFAPTGGRVTVDIRTATTAAEVEAVARPIIAGNTTLVFVSATATGGQYWQYPVAGKIGNIDITESVASALFQVNGFAGGHEGLAAREARRVDGYVGVACTTFDIAIDADQHAPISVSIDGITVTDLWFNLEFRVNGSSANLGKSGTFSQNAVAAPTLSGGSDPYPVTVNGGGALAGARWWMNIFVMPRRSGKKRCIVVESGCEYNPTTGQWSTSRFTFLWDSVANITSVGAGSNRANNIAAESRYKVWCP